MKNARRSQIVVGGLLVGLGLVVAGENDASACGGCFAPPESDSVVTDHRMILSVSPQQTTLYDQIRYTGSPSSFAWVLPISGTATVGLSADVVFATLDGLTQSQVIQPPLNCPAPLDDCSRNAPNASFGAGGAEDGNQDAGVAVTKTEVVGPYETVQLHSTDGAALNNWLTSHGYAIPADVAPIITAYVDAHFDFLAMKLAPGKSVQSMRPVRISTDGAAPILPLRMVTAGTGAVVGITLWVVAEGRYEPQNFPSFHIGDSDLVWDWTTSSSNFTKLRADKEAALGGKGWEVESSTAQLATQFTSYVMNGGFYGGGFGGGVAQAAADYDPITDANGVVTKTADQVRDEDMAALFAGIATPEVRFTRMRSDLAHAALADDLALQASQDQTVLTNVRTVSKESGQPNCPVYDGCSQVGTAPRDQAAAMTAMNGRYGTGGSCSTASRSILPFEQQAPLTLFALSGFLGMAIHRSRRRR